MWGRTNQKKSFAGFGVMLSAVTVAAASGHAAVVDCRAAADIGVVEPARDTPTVSRPSLTLGISTLGGAACPSDAAPWLPTSLFAPARLINPATDIDLGVLVSHAADTTSRRRARHADHSFSMGAWGGAGAGNGKGGDSAVSGSTDDPDDSGTRNFEGKKVTAADTKYFQDFESGRTPPEWEVGGINQYPEFGSFAGPFRTATQTLYVQCDPDEPYSCEFDLLFIAASLGDPAASDQFEVKVDGKVVLSSRFVELEESNQKLNGDRPDFDPRIFRRLSIVFTPTGNGVVTIQFSGKDVGLPGGETWGLDNVHIDKAPRQSLGELGGAPRGALGFAGLFNGPGAGSDNNFSPPRNYTNQDPSFRPAGGGGGKSGKPQQQLPTPAPGTGIVMLGGAFSALRRRRSHQ